MPFPTNEKATDTRLIALKKELGCFQNRTGADPQNNPLDIDTVRLTLVKLVRAWCTPGGAPPPPTPPSLACGSATGTVGVGLSLSLATTGGVGPFTYSIATGSLPPGMNLNTATGAITGTPTTAGTYSYTAHVVDSTSASATTPACTITIVPALSLGCSTTAGGGSATGVVGASLTLFPSRTGGLAPFTYAIIGGSLPPGVILNATSGTIGGIPTTVGTYNYSLKITDSLGNTVTTPSCTITIGPGLFLSCGSGSGEAGVAFSVGLTVSGGLSPYTYSIVSGSLPPGLTLNTVTGVISGTPTTAGTYNYTAQVEDSHATVVWTSGCTLTVVSAVSLACGSATGTVGVSFGLQLGVTGGQGPYTYSIVGGSLPPGMSLNGSTGVIQGTPTTPGTYNYTARVSDSMGGIVNSPGCTITIVSGLSLACSSATGTVGKPMSASLSATGGQGPYSYSIATGGLPPGMSLNSSTGAITGTPTGAGTFNYTAKVVDSFGSSATSPGCTLTVVSALSLSCGSGTGTVGLSLSIGLTTIGGQGPFTYSIASGSLPPGLSLGAGGVISGTPTTAGTYNYTAHVSDSLGNVANTSGCAITIVPVLSLACGNATGTVGVAFGLQLTTSGGLGPYSYLLAGGSLPPGMSLNGSTGVIQGTPTTPGTYNYTARVQDALGNVVNSPGCTITIVAALSLSCSSGNGTIGVPMNVSLPTSGGLGPFTYALASGALPGGMTLNTSTGAITGTPTATGTFNYRATVTDSLNNTATTPGCTITIVPALTLACGAGAGTGTVGVAVNWALTKGGGQGPFSYAVVSGSFPAGLTLNGSTGVITGTPTTAGTFNYTARVQDSLGNIASTNCTITIVTAPTLACGSGSGTVGTAFSLSLSASGGLGPYSYSLATGSLPPPLSLNVNGTISGTPNAAGTYNYTARVQDSLGNVASTPGCTITIAASGPTAVGYWPMNGNANDASGNGNNLTPTGDTANLSWPTSANPNFAAGNCAFFPYPGSGGGGFYKSGVASPLPVYNNSTGFTVSLWYKGVTPTNAFANGWWYGEIAPSEAAYWGINCTGGGTPRVVIHPGGANPELSINFSTSLVFNGNWHHLAVTVDTSGNVLLYFDGASSGSGTWNWSALVASLNAVTIGCSGGTLPNSCLGQLIGSVDEIQVYRVALTAAQISNLFNLNHP